MRYTFPAPARFRHRLERYSVAPGGYDSPGYTYWTCACGCEIFVTYGVEMATTADIRRRQRVHEMEWR